MPIHLLSPDVIGKIAAGEVVERPVSVVKELVENALDAGSRSVSVEIVAGGCDLIRVADDGCGITGEELPLAVQRHATSKLLAAEELNSVSTLGFRGEALASIAAVSEMTLLSATPSALHAHEMHLVAGKLLQTGAATRTRGTTIIVERLFFNLPARRKYLRSAAAEAAHVAQLLSHLAIAYPEVAFDLIIDGRRSLNTPGTGDPLDAALKVLGKDAALALLPLYGTVETDRPVRGVAAHVSGFVADPRISRSTRSGIWLTVNRRPVRSRALSYAVEEAYATLLMVGRHPVAVVDLQVPPAEVDVNVHPTKVEVRLLRERLIDGGLRDVVRSVIAADSSWGKEVGGLARVDNPPEDGGEGFGMARLVEAPLASASPPTEEFTTSGRRIPILRLIGQVAQSYIVAEGEAGVYLIDQHAAHERVLLERLRRGMDRPEKTQLLLEPVLLELPSGEWELAQAAWSALEVLGYTIEAFGDGAMLIRGIPSQLGQGEAVKALQESLHDLLDEKPEADWRERIAVALSCRGAVKAGQVLSFEEMRSLVEALEETDMTQHCSHGRPTAILLSHHQLEREFGRR